MLFMGFPGAIVALSIIYDNVLTHYISLGAWSCYLWVLDHYSGLPFFMLIGLLFIIYDGYYVSKDVQQEYQKYKGKMINE